MLPSAKNHYYSTIPYVNPTLTLNEPPLQRSAHVVPSVCPSPQEEVGFDGYIKSSASQCVTVAVLVRSANDRSRIDL